MLLKHCLICSKESLRKNGQTFSGFSRNPFGGSKKNIPIGKCNAESQENRSVENQLQVVFLLRKLLEIPEDTCCLLLQHFGNPNLWVECCDTCSDLVKECHTTFEKIASLQKHYENLRLDIKSAMLKSQKTSTIESKCEAIVRSYVITQDVAGFIKTPETELTQHKNAENSESNFELGNRWDVSSNFLKEKQSFNECGPPLVMNSDIVGLNGDEEIPVPFITDANCSVNSSAPANENTESLCSESDTAVDIDPRPYICKTQVLLEEINEVKSELEISDSLDVNLEVEEISDSIMEASEFLQPSKELKNSQQKRPSGQKKTQEANDTIKLLLNDLTDDCSTEDSHSYIIPDDDFETHSEIHNEVEIPEEPKIDNCFGKMENKRKSIGKFNKRQFECAVCGKSFKYSSTLKIHQKSHGKKNECNICRKSFKSFRALNNHTTRYHEGNKMSKCKVCCLLFEGKLKMHLKICTGKPFFCKICDVSFTTNWSLQRHHMYHKGERRFSCDVCDKSFMDRRDFEDHQRIHTGDKPYECEICGKSFRLKWSCVKHLKRHSGWKP